jgi:parallel beta-helix repeat protein
LINSTNITVENLDLKENIQGLLMASTNSSQIIKNCITSNDLAGIHFDILCFNNTVSGNSITDQDWSGVLSKYSFNNTLIGNTVSNNTIGFYLKTSFNNALTQNILANNSRGGVWLDYSFNNILVSNTIMGNSAKQISDAGVSLYQSYINKIFHNNFINNQRQAYTCPGNIWDDGYPSGGNYWSDYSGADQYRGVYQSFDGNDGIGDTPYIVDASNKDQYPLMQPWTPVLISIEPQTTIGTPVGETFTIDINISNVRNLYLWQFKLVFNPAIISATIVAQGPFLEQAGTTFFIPMVDNTQGYVLVGAFLRGPPPPEGAYGNGTLASVTFQVKSAGQTPIQFDKMWTKLRTDMMGSIIPIEHETRDGYFSNPVISCNVNIDPDTLNLKSKSKWITAYIQLPEGYNAEDIDASTILLNGTIQPILESKYDFVTNSTEYIVDHNGDGILERMVKFNKTEVASWIHDDLNIQYGNLTLTITGKLLDETLFEATNIIKVLFPGDADGDGDVDFDDFIILAGCYGGNAGTSSYDQLADFNQDGPIDFDDFVILAGNYGKTAL